MEGSVQTSPLPLFLDTLVDRLLARPNLQGVSITSAEVTVGANEYLMFIDANEEQRWGSNARLRRESDIFLNGVVYTAKAGAGEAIIREVRNRAFEIVGEVETELRGSTLGHIVAGIDGEATVKTTEVTSIDMDQGMLKGARWCSLLFEIKANASTILTG